MSLSGAERRNLAAAVQFMQRRYRALIWVVIEHHDADEADARAEQRLKPSSVSV